MSEERVDSPPAPASRVTRPMGLHIASAGGAAAMLSTVFVWLSHWPLQPLDNATGDAWAGLSVIAAGYIVQTIGAVRNGKAQ